MTNTSKSQNSEKENQTGSYELIRKRLETKNQTLSQKVTALKNSEHWVVHFEKTNDEKHD